MKTFRRKHESSATVRVDAQDKVSVGSPQACAPAARQAQAEFTRTSMAAIISWWSRR